MDPHFDDSSLQKTSPNNDPAVLAQLSSELSAQTHQLSLHHHQLNRLTTLTEELVKTLQGFRLASSDTPASSAIPPTDLAINPHLAFPEKFDGNPARCKGFLLQCSLFVKQQPGLYPTDSSRISFVFSLLTKRALDWVTAVWRDDRKPFPTFAVFLQHFREVFEHPVGGKSAGDQLLMLCQVRRWICLNLPNPCCTNQLGWGYFKTTIQKRIKSTTSSWTGMPWWGEITEWLRWTHDSDWQFDSLSPTHSSSSHGNTNCQFRTYATWPHSPNGSRMRTPNPTPSLLILWSIRTPKIIVSHSTSHNIWIQAGEFSILIFMH